MLKNHSQALAKAVSALTLIAAPRRPDGTYNRERAACEQLAREALREIDALTGSQESLSFESSAPAAPRPVQPAVPSSGIAEAPKGALGTLTEAPRQPQGRSFVVYSDGACKGNPGPSSWGVVVLGSDEEVLLAEAGFIGQATNQVAELMAALEALRRTPVGSKVVLYSDSQYTLNGISQWRKNWAKNGWLTADKQPVKNKEIWVALAAEADKRTVETRWVRGHSGDTYNEMCDELANEAIAARGPIVRS